MVTRYSQIALEFGTLISRGVLRPGDRIPSGSKACQQYRVNAGTICKPTASLRPGGGRTLGRGRLLGSRKELGLAPTCHLLAASRRHRVDVASLVFEVLASIKDREIIPLGSAFSRAQNSFRSRS